MEPVSPPHAFDNHDHEAFQAPGKEDFGKRSPDLDLNQAVSPRADDDDAENYPSQPLQPHWGDHANLNSDMPSPRHLSPPPPEPFSPIASPTSPPPLNSYQRLSPLPEHFTASRSPKRTPSPVEKRALSPANNLSVSPVYHSTRKSPSSGRSLTPPARKRSPPLARKRSSSPRRRQSPRKRRSLSMSPDERSGLLTGSDEGRRNYDRHGSPPIRRGGRGASPRGRERYGRSRSRSRSPAGRDYYRRSRYSPRRRQSPPRYHSKRDRSPRRRPWSPPANRSTGVGKPGKNLFVAGFSFVTTERDLEKKFSRFGRVTDVRIVRDKRSGDSRGFGFLSLERDEDADAAIRTFDQTEWNGRIVLVEKDFDPEAESHWVF